MPDTVRFPAFSRHGFFVSFLALIAICAMPTQRALADHSGHAHGTEKQASARAMTDEQMRKGIAEWFAKRPEIGEEASRRAIAQGAFADTFFAYFTEFDNGNGGTPDVAEVFEGETVLWQWVEGTHTITNGEDSFDPNAGTMFNVSHNSGNQSFAFTFTEAGTYPFFCVIHESLPMNGVVHVSKPPASVTPIGSAVARIGFTRPPSPNPSRSGFTFRFGMRERGHVRAQVFDASGRAVSTVIDRDLEPGSYAASWDGRGRSGNSRPGVYWLRLRVPGVQESRRLVVSE